MARIDDILALPDIGTRIEKLKRSRGIYAQTDRYSNWADWNELEHEILTDRTKYPDQNIIVEKGRTIIDSNGKTYKTDDKREKVEANRIALPVEQDLVNIHTAFAVGTEPKITCDSDDADSRKMLAAVKATMRKNFMHYRNKQLVRSWLAEQEVAEYWYRTGDADGFWAKLWRKIGGGKGIEGQARLKSTVWSPFRGDDIYPFMENDEMTGFLRGYKVKADDDSEQQCYMCLTATHVYTWRQVAGSWKEERFAHGFGKMPVIYMWRPQPLYRKVRTLRIRLEKLLSEYADCIDYHFFPYLILRGNIETFQGKNRNHIIQLMGEGSSAQYLTWSQVPDTVKFEAENLTDMIYTLTNTPRLSFKDLSGTSPVSGESFKYRFMGSSLASEDEYETIGEFLQRRVNFLVTALGQVNADLYGASQVADLLCEPQTYSIDDLSRRVATAVQAVGGGIWSRREGIMFAGNTERVEEELESIKAEQAAALAAKGKGDAAQALSGMLGGGTSGKAEQAAPAKPDAKQKAGKPAEAEAKKAAPKAGGGQ